MYFTIKIDKDSPEPLQDQLITQLRQMIVNGNLKPNTQVIATRFFAEQIDVSRMTVLLAYERLISEGYLETRPGIGTFVTTNVPDAKTAAPESKKRTNLVRQASLYPPYFQVNKKLSAPEENRATRIDFGSFHADPALLPAKAWGQKVQAIIGHRRLGLAEYPPLAGIDPLKLAIANWLALHRNIIVSPKQVIIVAGRQQARHLVARPLLQQNDNVIVEAPCQSDMVHLFQAMHAHLVPIPVDDQGIRTDLLPESPARLAYVTPNHQRPLGGTLPLQRRELLIEWARRSGCYIIEDDCDGKFRYQGLAPPTLASLDAYGLVFHLGTFSKTLGAGLCLGYLVVPEEFIEPVTTLKTMFSKGCSWLDQTVLADFISSGDYDHHLRRMRKVYMDRRDCLIDTLRAAIPTIRLIGAETGSQITCLLPEGAPSAQVIQVAVRKEGINISTLADDYFSQQQHLPEDYLQRALILGYSTLHERQIREGISILSRIIGRYPPLVS